MTVSSPTSQVSEKTGPLLTAFPRGPSPTPSHMTPPLRPPTWPLPQPLPHDPSPMASHVSSPLPPQLASLSCLFCSQPWRALCSWGPPTWSGLAQSHTLSKVKVRLQQNRSPGEMHSSHRLWGLRDIFRVHFRNFALHGVGRWPLTHTPAWARPWALCGGARGGRRAPAVCTHGSQSTGETAVRQEPPRGRGPCR